MLQKVDIKDADKLKDIAERNIEACSVGGRTSFDYIKATSTLFAAQDNIGIWTDDIEDPHLLLIATRGKFGILNEVFCFVNTIYVDPDHRNPETLKQMLDTAMLWARSKNCDVVQVSSWIYRGCEDIGNLWESLGYEAQETIYVKGV